MASVLGFSTRASARALGNTRCHNPPLCFLFLSVVRGKDNLSVVSALCRERMLWRMVGDVSSSKREREREREKCRVAARAFSTERAGYARARFERSVCGVSRFSRQDYKEFCRDGRCSRRCGSSSSNAVQQSRSAGPRDLAERIKTAGLFLFWRERHATALWWPLFPSLAAAPSGAASA